MTAQFSIKFPPSIFQFSKFREESNGSPPATNPSVSLNPCKLINGPAPSPTLHFLTHAHLIHFSLFPHAFSTFSSVCPFVRLSVCCVRVCLFVWLWCTCDERKLKKKKKKVTKIYKLKKKKKKNYSSRERMDVIYIVESGT